MVVVVCRVVLATVDPSNATLSVLTSRDSDIHAAFARSKPFEVHFLDSIVRTRSRWVDYVCAFAEQGYSDGSQRL
jgi:hypothetical protein